MYIPIHNLNIEGVVQAYNLEKYQNTLVILFEDFGGESLKIWMSKKKFTLPEFFSIAIKITKILGKIHSSHIIHKDINPSNIVFNPYTQQLKLIDFGISTILSRDNILLTKAPLKNPNIQNSRNGLKTIDPTTSTDPRTTSSGSSEALDLATVIKATQAISGEMMLEQLLRKLMKILIENAGAQKGSTKTAFEEALLLYNLNSFREAAQGFEEVLLFNPEDTVARIYLHRCQGINK